MLNNEQKKEILRLRKLGYGYRSISNVTKISRDTVRNLCKKHDLTGYGRKGMEGAKGIEFQDKCQKCGAEINHTNKPGRKAKFCSDECRNAWWKQNAHKKSRDAWYDFKCQHCGKDFKAYGNKNRKFCSVRCSTEYRFGGTTQDEKVFF